VPAKIGGISQKSHSSVKKAQLIEGKPTFTKRDQGMAANTGLNNKGIYTFVMQMLL
jgi:hypothetical protein